MDLSVLMSVYAKEKPSYFEEALKSLTDQNCKAEEVIIVEDGIISNEFTSIIEKYRKDLNIKSVKLLHNSGLAVALNEGLKHCKNDYIVRMDSDDISLPNRFEKQVEFMENYPNVSVSSGYINEINNEGKWLSVRTLPLSFEEISLFAKSRNPVSHSCVIFKKESVLSVGGYPLLYRSQDYALWSLMLYKGFIIQNTADMLVNMRAGNDMLDRRGFYYRVKEIKVLQYQWKIGFIDSVAFLQNLFGRIILRLSPRFIKKFLYKHRKCY